MNLLTGSGHETYDFGMVGYRHTQFDIRMVSKDVQSRRHRDAVELPPDLQYVPELVRVAEETVDVVWHGSAPRADDAVPAEMRAPALLQRTLLGLDTAIEAVRDNLLPESRTRYEHSRGDQ